MTSSSVHLKPLFKAALRLIGVALFVWILSKIDRTQLLIAWSNASPPLIVLSFALLMISYAIKSIRWHTLVRAAGLHPTWHDSWRLFHLGIFFGNLTPSNLGELGKVAYLKKDGLSPAAGFALIAIDRTLDTVVVGLIGIVSIGIFFGCEWMFLLFGLSCLGLAMIVRMWKKMKAALRMSGQFSFVPKLLTGPTALTLSLSSIAAWMSYFAWTITLGRALGIDLALPSFVAALTLTGLVALLPIAPAGLGTRDAALLTFLGMYGIAPEQSVAMSVGMAVLILCSCGPGLWYWLRGGNLGIQRNRGIQG